MTAGLTALESLVAHSPSGFMGIRDETAGCAFGLSALDRFRGSRFEVYTADDTMLSKLAAHGGAGAISPGANLLGRPELTLLEAPGTVEASRSGRVIEAAGKIFRTRPSVPAIKSLIARNTGRSEWSKVRLPLRQPGPEERASLFRAFDAAGIQLRPARLAEEANP
jgi:dihydrodipicolinate synthase/N-acetylneuraminate lyase